MPKKRKTKVQKEMNSSTPNYRQKTQYDIAKEIKPDKIKPKEIFEGNPKKTKLKSKKKKSKSY